MNQTCSQPRRLRSSSPKNEARPAQSHSEQCSRLVMTGESPLETAIMILLPKEY